MAAAREAWQHAGIEGAEFDPARVGVVMGSSRGPADIVDASAAREIKRPSEAVYTAFSSAPGILASAFGIKGFALSVSATCTSGAAAIQTARQMLRSGDFDIVLAGGADAPLIDSILQRMHSTGTLSASQRWDEALKPFDAHRDGTALGEGAAFLVLETASSAARRGVPSHGVLLGAAITCEPHSRTRPSKDCEGLQRAVRVALNQASAPLPRVDMLHLHGTGTAVNDLEESACVSALYPSHSEQPISWASKGITGHTLGAASAFQAVLTLLAMRHSYLPGTANCTVQDPGCRIRLSLADGSSQIIRTALCLTSGFWGKSSCLYLGAPELR
jgi:3-oxoacyl-[acyl-carrier-protein] synthase II